MFTRVDFPNYMPMHPGIDYLCGKCFIYLPSKVRKNPGNVESQVNFKQHSILKCYKNIINFYMFFGMKKYMKHCVAATHSIDKFCPCFFSVLFVSTNSELAKTQGLH